MPGKSNSRADILSRRPGFDKGDDDNEGVMVLPAKRFCSLFLHSLQGWDNPWKDRIFNTLTKEGREFPDETVSRSCNEDDLWEFDGHIYVPYKVTDSDKKSCQTITMLLLLDTQEKIRQENKYFGTIGGHCYGKMSRPDVRHVNRSNHHDRRRGQLYIHSLC
jgi:hypothetical protein